MKRFYLLLAILMLLSGCSRPISNEPVEATPESTSGIKDEFVVIGKYVCKSQYCEGLEEECTPEINFYEDGTCRMFVNYLEGGANIKGEYSVESDKVFVKLDFTNSIFEGSGTKYMDDTYVFSIENDDNITIDRHVYVVNAGDAFERISIEPEETTVLSPNIVGKYVCSNDYYNDEYVSNNNTTIPYIKFFEGYECAMYVDHGDDTTFVEGNDLESSQRIYGVYKVTDGKIKISLHFLPSITGEHPLVDKMDSEYTLTLIDEDHLVIDKGFFNVRAGDVFVRTDSQ